MEEKEGLTNTYSQFQEGKEEREYAIFEKN